MYISDKKQVNALENLENPVKNKAEIIYRLTAYRYMHCQTCTFNKYL